MPWLTPADRPAAVRWAKFEWLADVVFAELKNGGLFTSDKEARRLLNEYRKLVLAQHTIAQSLGMTPAARMGTKTGKPDGLDLAAQFTLADADAAAEPESPAAYAETQALGICERW